MKQANSNAATIGAALAGATAVPFTEKEKAFADAIVKAANGTIKASEKAAGARDGLYGAIIGATIAGAGFAAMEAANTELTENKKVNQNYKPIKSMILSAVEHGVTLVDEKGKARGKGALADLTTVAKAKKAGLDLNGTDGKAKSMKALRAELKGEKEDANGKTAGPVQRTATPEEIIGSAVAHLTTSAELRERFAGEIMAIAKLLANDDAVKRTNRERAEKAAADRKAAKPVKAKAAADAVKADAAALAADYGAHGLTKAPEFVGPMQAALQTAGIA